MERAQAARDDSSHIGGSFLATVTNDGLAVFALFVEVRWLFIAIVFLPA
jgi:hypothetical protein